MTQRGHVLDDAWYLDYAAGSLVSEAERVLVRSHIELNTEAEDRIARLDTIGGALLDQLPVGEPLPFSADELLALADTDVDAGVETRDDVAALPRALDGVDLPPALASYLVRTGVKVKWEFLGPGLRKAILENFTFLGLEVDDARNNNNETLISTDGSKVAALKIHTNEELVIALDTYNLIK